MAGKIIADTLEHSTAGSVTTDYVVNGSAKAWINFDGTGTIAARDSLNFSSLTDDGTGLYTVTISSAMNNDDYGLNVSNVNPHAQINTTGNMTTTAFATRSRNSSHSNVDADTNTASIHGDLA